MNVSVPAFNFWYGCNLVSQHGYRDQGVFLKTLGFISLKYTLEKVLYYRAPSFLDEEASDWQQADTRIIELVKLSMAEFARRARSFFEEVHSVDESDIEQESSFPGSDDETSTDLETPTTSQGV